MTPEQKARAEIDLLLAAAGWNVVDPAVANIHDHRGVALREFPLASGHGHADYLLYVDGKAAGVIEAKKKGATLTGVEIQSGRYAQGLPTSLPAWRRPLPFIYESTGAETHFTSGLDPEPRARNIFAFHRPETLGEWLATAPLTTVLNTDDGETANVADFAPVTFLARVRAMPQLITSWPDGGSERNLWPAQITAIPGCDLDTARRTSHLVLGQDSERTMKTMIRRARPVASLLPGPTVPDPCGHKTLSVQYPLLTSRRRCGAAALGRLPAHRPPRFSNATQH